jgi:indolepyruvate ferredoxin oxidoreductase
VVDLPRVATVAGVTIETPAAKTLDDLIASRAAHLTGYQGRRTARRYKKLVARVREREEKMFSGATALTEAVARNYAKLIAYKDEYEVARLFSTKQFRDTLAAQFDTPARLEFHLAPPLLAKRDPRTGELQKRAYGPWMLTAFRVLAKLRFLRATRLDPFGRTEERRAERRLIADYEVLVEELLSSLDAETVAVAVALASLPEKIRGFGHVKDKTIRVAEAERTVLLQRLRQPTEKLAAD